MSPLEELPLDGPFPDRPPWPAGPWPPSPLPAAAPGLPCSACAWLPPRPAALPPPPRLSRAEAGRRLSPLQMSFLRESRRIGNRRLKNELKLRLAYPTVDDGIRAALERKSAC